MSVAADLYLKYPADSSLMDPVDSSLMDPANSYLKDPADSYLKDPPLTSEIQARVLMQAYARDQICKQIRYTAIQQTNKHKALINISLSYEVFPILEDRLSNNCNTRLKWKI